RDPNKPAWAKPAKHAHGKPFRNRTDSVTGASKRDGLDVRPGQSPFQHRKGPRKVFANAPAASTETRPARTHDGKRPFVQKPRSTRPGDRPVKRGKPKRRQP
ncbi:MAG: hypothetical protein SGJ21_12240, partial [Alphaproteobacteria bacterium]|nr:hypothetical protein [Alphaproteobacteria bacterium]